MSNDNNPNQEQYDAVIKTVSEDGATGTCIIAGSQDEEVYENPGGVTFIEEDNVKVIVINSKGLQDNPSVSPSHGNSAEHSKGSGPKVRIISKGGNTAPPPNPQG